MTKEFGSTYLCNRLLHRQLGEGGGSYGWLCRCSHKDSHFSTTCTTVLVTDDDDGDDDGCVVRTHNCGMPHCGGTSDEDLPLWHASFTSWWGEGSLPAMSPSQAAVWDHFCFPLVAPPVPPRYTLPKSSLDSCLAQTSNVVQASLAMLPLKNLCLRCNQMAAARSQVGPYHGSHARDATQGSRTLSNQDSHSSAVIFGGGSCTRLR